MKQPKKLTRNQKEKLTEKGLVQGNWMLAKEKDGVLTLINKLTGKAKVLVT